MRYLSLLLPLFGSQNMHTEQCQVFQAHHHHTCMAGCFNPTRGSKEKTDRHLRNDRHIHRKAGIGLAVCTLMKPYQSHYD